MGRRHPEFLQWQDEVDGRDDLIRSGLRNRASMQATKRVPGISQNGAMMHPVGSGHVFVVDGISITGRGVIFDGDWCLAAYPFTCPVCLLSPGIHSCRSTKGSFQ